MSICVIIFSNIPVLGMWVTGHLLILFYAVDRYPFIYVYIGQWMLVGFAHAGISEGSVCIYPVMKVLTPYTHEVKLCVMIRCSHTSIVDFGLTFHQYFICWSFTLLICLSVGITKVDEILLDFLCNILMILISLYWLFLQFLMMLIFIWMSLVFVMIITILAFSYYH